MKTFKVFIASSAELQHERRELVDLLLDLNDELEGQDIKFKPILWEYMDSSMRTGRKEDEYLEKLRECEKCLVLFWRTLGEYTEEEFNVAVAEMQAGRLPQQVHVLLKEPAKEISEELCLFKQKLSIKFPDIPVLIFEDARSLRKVVTTILQNKNTE